MRVFIAIPLSGRVRRAMEQVVFDMKKSGARGHYTPVENMHLTLAFIGETEEIREIGQALDQVRFQPFRLVTEGFGHFGNLYWVGIKKEPALDRLVRDVRKALYEAGIPYDRKSFKAHITIARKVEARQAIRVRIPKIEMNVDYFSLMKSERVKGGMRYSELDAWEAFTDMDEENLTGASCTPSQVSNGSQESLPLCLESSRLLIRQIRDQDKKDYLYGLSFASEHRSVYEDEEIAGLLWQDVLRDQDSITLIIYDRQTGQVVGTCSFDHWNSNHPEVGINVDPSRHNQGLGTETVVRLMEAFKKLRPHEELLIRTKSSNVSCQKMIDKCGGRRLDQSGQDMKNDLLSYRLVAADPS